MTKKILAVLLAMLMLAALTGCNSDSNRIAELEAENAQLRAQVAELTAQLESAAYPAGLSDWSFDAVAWSGNNGATVTFTGTPVSHEDGQTAELSVWLEGDRIDTVSCTWDGSAYTASVDLNAADGYCYYLLLTEANGNEMEVELNTPKATTDASVIDLETSLTAYCSMMVEESTVEGDALTITAGYVQVQLPVIGQTGDAVSVASAELVLIAEGQENSRYQLFLQEGESPNSYTAQIVGTVLSVPAMEDDQQLELRMEVALSDGQTLTTAGGSWYYNAGELFLVVG